MRIASGYRPGQRDKEAGCTPFTLASAQTDGAGMAWGVFDIAPGLAHLQFGLQAATVVVPPGGNSNQMLFSNAVRVIVGGGL